MQEKKKNKRIDKVKFSKCSIRLGGKVKQDYSVARYNSFSYHIVLSFIFSLGLSK